MSHVCPGCQNSAPAPTVFTPTDGICQLCGGLLCPVHGCNRHTYPSGESK